MCTPYNILSNTRVRCTTYNACNINIITYKSWHESYGMIFSSYSEHMFSAPTVRTTLNEFSTSREIFWKFNADETSISNNSLDYGIIRGLDLVTELDFIIGCNAKIVKWEDLKIPMTRYHGTLSRKQFQTKLVNTKEPACTIAERK